MVALPDAMVGTGLDLNDPKVYKLAKDIYYKRFSARVKWAGYDEDDGFQDILLGLVRRQQGKSRFDPKRSSMSNYLFLAMTGMTRNMADSAKRKWGTMGTTVPLSGKTRERQKDHQDRRYEDGVYPDADAGWDPLYADEAYTGLMLEDLAAEMEVPVAVLIALRDGQDPCLAALDAGMDPIGAFTLLESLGHR